MAEAGKPEYQVFFHAPARPDARRGRPPDHPARAPRKRVRPEAKRGRPIGSWGRRISHRGRPDASRACPNGQRGHPDKERGRRDGRKKVLPQRRRGAERGRRRRVLRWNDGKSVGEPILLAPVALSAKAVPDFSPLVGRTIPPSALNDLKNHAHRFWAIANRHDVAEGRIDVRADVECFHRPSVTNFPFDTGAVNQPGI